MVKETITYHDLDGNEITKDFHFNLYPSELAELSVSKKGGLPEYIKKISAAEDLAELIALFKDILLRAYGERGEDNQSFVKSPELSRAFSQTEAYSILFMKLATDEKAAAKFINALAPAMPQDNLPKDTKAKTTKK